jgi:DNA polymerase-3 subunit delta
MPESQFSLIFGDPYRCERALAARHTAILAEDPDTERHTLFGDELDMPSLRVELQSTPLFALGRHFVVRHIDAIKDVKRFAALVKRELPPSTFLTLLAGELKESNPIVKAAKACGSVQALPRAKGKGLERAALKILTEHDLNLTQEALKELLTRSGGNLLVILQEARKLHAFSPKELIDERSIKRLSFTAGEGSIYPFLDRVGERNLKAALATLATIYEDPGRIFSALLRHLTRVLMVRVLLDREITATKMATMIASPGWLVRRLIIQAKAHPVQRLTAVLDLGINLDLKVKSGGIRPADALLKLILAATTPASPVQEYARRSQPSRATID